MMNLICSILLYVLFMHLLAIVRVPDLLVIYVGWLLDTVARGGGTR
jgi:hypothetical protein